jgi:DNA-binding NarL/FixJ family response regulator
MNIRVSIVEDAADVGQSLSLLINGSEGFACASTHRSSEDAIRELPAIAPNVVLMDLNLPGMSGVECIRNLRPLLPNTQFLVLTMYEDTNRIFEALSAGANGYLLKRTAPGKLVDAIREVHEGGSPMSSQIARAIVQHFQQRKNPSAGFDILTPRENEILKHLSNGLRYKEIAALLGISYDTVRAHLRNIYDKLQVSSRTEAVVKYLNR